MWARSQGPLGGGRVPVEPPRCEWAHLGAGALLCVLTEMIAVFPALALRFVSVRLWGTDLC